MASFGHIAVGMAAGRAYRPESLKSAVWPMVIFSGLALLPDLDYVGVMLGIPNVGPCGHRGASHSLVTPMLIFAGAIGLSPTFGLPRWRTALTAALVVVSHPLLDAFTALGRGVPLFWPLSFHRFVAPWRPIPDAPCGLGLVSMRGLRVISIELCQFFPLVIFALRPSAPGGARAPAGATYRVESRS